jgi:hypothetical protein
VNSKISSPRPTLVAGHITVVVDAAQCLAQHGLGSGEPVVRCDVEDVDTGVEGGVYGGDAIRSAKVP